MLHQKFYLTWDTASNFKNVCSVKVFARYAINVCWIKYARLSLKYLYSLISLYSLSYTLPNLVQLFSQTNETPYAFMHNLLYLKMNSRSKSNATSLIPISLIYPSDIASISKELNFSFYFILIKQHMDSVFPLVFTSVLHTVGIS